VERSGNASGFWKRAEHHLERAKSLSLNAFRLGVAWERVQPIHFLPQEQALPLVPPPVDEKALDRYAAILAYCQKLGLEPVITLHHFTHPAWLGPDAWLREETVQAFVSFVEQTVAYLLKALPKRYGSSPPRIFLTINEPNVLALCSHLFPVFPVAKTRGLAPLLQALANLLRAHVRAYDTIHRLYAGSGVTPWVSLNLYSSNLYWLDLAWWDLLHAGPLGLSPKNAFRYLEERARRFERLWVREFSPRSGLRERLLGPLLRALQRALPQALRQNPFWEEALLELSFRSEPPLDFVAFDYYTPLAEDWLCLPRRKDLFYPKEKNLPQRLAYACARKWWDWPARPELLPWVVTRLGEFGLPLLVAENGMAERWANGQPVERRDGLTRADFIRRHLREILRLRQEGHPLFGYFYWSLSDNYEWGTYDARFGLFSVAPDGRLLPKTQELEADSAAGAYAEEVVQGRKFLSV
jgi:beta-glucosidase